VLKLKKATVNTKSVVRSSGIVNPLETPTVLEF